MRIGIFLKRPDFFTAAQSTPVCLAAVAENTGNMAFLSSVARLVPPSAEFVGWDVTGEELAEFDVIVVPASSFLSPEIDLGFLAKPFIEAGVPTLVLGLGLHAPLGVQLLDLPSGTVSWLRAIAASAPSGVVPIHVRGDKSKELLGRYGIESLVSGCPALFLNDNARLGELIRSRGNAVDQASLNWAVIPAGIGAPRAVRTDRLLWRLADQSSGYLPWILQDDAALIELIRRESDNCDSPALEASAWHHAPWLRTGDFAAWVRGSGAYFFEPGSYGEHLRRFDFVLSARIHGAILAMQAGVPTVLVAHDERVLELATTCNLPFVLPGGDSPLSASLMSDAFSEWDDRGFDARRGALAGAMAAGLTAFGLPEPVALKSLLSETGPKERSAA